MLKTTGNILQFKVCDSLRNPKNFFFFNFSSFLFLFIPFFFSSCDKVDYPFEQLPVYDICGKNVVYTVNSSDTNSTKRVVLIEEFTGHTCSNCPDGAREVQRIDSLYDSQVIPVSIHAGYFAKPHNPPDTAYLTDFRTTEGEVYNGSAGFNVWGNPSAMISRKDDGSGNLVLPKGYWENAVKKLLPDVPAASINITNFYNDSLRCLKTKVNIKWLSSASGNYKLQLYIIEDHIKDWQLDGSFNNPNYDHRHVLRKSMNGTWGSEIAASNANDTLSFDFYLDLSTKWNSANCEVVAFIYNYPSYEVIQASEAKVKN